MRPVSQPLKKASSAPPDATARFSRETSVSIPSRERRRPVLLVSAGVKGAGFTITTSLVPDRCDEGTGMPVMRKQASAAKSPAKPDRIERGLDVDDNPTAHLMCVAADAILPGATLVAPYITLVGDVLDYAICKGVARDFYRMAREVEHRAGSPSS